MNLNFNFFELVVVVVVVLIVNFVSFDGCFDWLEGVLLLVVYVVLGLVFYFYFVIEGLS